MSEEQSAAPAQKQVLMQKIFVRDASLEVPNAPDIFAQEWQPKLDVQLNTAVQDLRPEVHQVVLTVTVNARLGERTAYHAEVQEAGIFVLRGFADEAERKAVLGSYCPSVLFPFVREAIADLIQRAGFPHFLLQPVNFDALYQQHLARQQEAATQEAPAVAAAEGDGLKH
jgi:preprotein translocase subunit SecB